MDDLRSLLASQDIRDAVRERRYGVVLRRARQARGLTQDLGPDQLVDDLAGQRWVTSRTCRATPMHQLTILYTHPHFR